MFCQLLYNLGIRVVMTLNFFMQGFIQGPCCIVIRSLLGLLVLVRGFVGIRYRVIELCIEFSVCFCIIGLY